MTRDFTGRTAFVTGGARGIGRTLAAAFAEAGATVAIADLDLAAAAGTAAAIGAERAVALACDVRDRASIAAAIAACEARFGGLDMLVNNAGRHTSAFNRPVTQVDEANWATMLATNVMGVVNCTTLVAEAMRRRGGGAIVNISSVAGVDVRTAYGVTKLAIRGLTVALAEELAPDNIRVNGVAPGLIATPTIIDDLPPERFDRMVSDMQLIKRPGRPEDLVGIVTLLCSEEASFITGETIIVGGGYARRP